MSEYLRQKLLRSLREEKVTDNMVENALNKGINNMVSSIGDMDIKTSVKREKPQVEKYTHYEGTELAELALDVYKTNVKPEESKKVPEYKATNPPPTRAKGANMSAIARSLAGMRNGGDVGQPAPPAGPNGGNTGVPGPSKYYALTTSMTLEEYEEHIHKKFGLVEEEELEPLQEPEQELLVEDNPIGELEEELLQLEDTSWQSIDKVMRVIASKYDMTPKELHKEFKATHNGLIPDDWIKKQEVTEECGWFPLNEAQLHRQGHVYDVSMIWKGNTTRSKFFWPESRCPSREEMQNAANGFYPGSRLMAYYPSEEEGDFMVLIPPLTENYEFVPFEEWVQLNDEDSETYQTIMEEVGEPVSTPELLLEGYYEVVVEDHDTGEHLVVHFGEGKSGEWKDPISQALKSDKKLMKLHQKDKKAPKGYVKEGAAWTKKEGQNSKGGLNEKGRKSYERENPGSDLKAPSKKVGNPRRASFCARMKGMRKRQKKSNNTGEDRLSKSLRAWNC